MKKAFKKCFLVMFCTLLVLCMMTALSYAEERVSLTITFKHNNRVVEDVCCNIYFIAEYNGEYSVCDDFKNYNISLDTSDSVQTKELAETLAGYVMRDGLLPYDSGITDEDGKISFPNNCTELKKGLYLILCEPFAKDGYAYNTEPILLSLPVYNSSDGTYLYSVNVEPKCSGEQEDVQSKVERNVLKLWKNDEEPLRPDSITVDLLRDDSIVDTVNLNEENNWRYEWNNLDEFNSDGTKIEWRAVERNVSGYTVTIIQDGTTFVMTNTYTSSNPHDEITSRSVKKVWDDSGYESRRPNYITVSLLRNGEVYDTGRLTAENGWQYSWEDLDNRDENGNEYVWSISEKSLSDYTSSVKENGTVFILTNKYKVSTLPQTGVLWWPVPVMVALSLMFFSVGVAYKKRR